MVSRNHNTWISNTKGNLFHWKQFKLQIYVSVAWWKHFLHEIMERAPCVLYISYIACRTLVTTPLEKNSAFPNVYIQMVLLLPEIILIFHLDTALTS